MAVAKRDGKTVKCSDHIYEFTTEDAAIGFESCCNGGGRPGACAEQWHCSSKRRIKKERGSGLEK